MYDKIIDEAIRKVPDFPKQGILFYDITSILTSPKVFKYCLDKMVSLYKDAKLDAIVAIESRGFLFASPLASSLSLPLVLARKKGKLPGETYSCRYNIEYGTAEIEVQRADIKAGSSFLVVDDLVATGGTLNAVRVLLEAGGASVAEYFSVIGLPKLNYEKILSPKKVTTLITYDGE